ncbi:hypothetical protein ANABIO32_29190 [Rossellomorea marisflavi]|uniref:hypothetical protein n=1 Tax=Rossellomorea marisflavi TaxID=189381 RepID=UPI0025CA0E89|nr:hypothetical protein [Rossellomorea marisflavi]GLI85195.1 hypothetical protein ANABIO32_29190 [Rossellomorea marisflavi]
MEDIKKEKKKTALRYSIKRFFISIIIPCIILIVLSQLLNLNRNYIFIISALIAVYLIYQAYRYYDDFLNFLMITYHIDTLKDKKNANIRLKEMINTNSMMLERFKLLLDLLKSFSPIPIVVFTLTLLRQIKFENGIINEILEITIENKIVYGLLLIFIVWYAIKIFNTWEKYKTIQFRNLQYQNAYDKIREAR